MSATIEIIGDEIVGFEDELIFKGIYTLSPKALEYLEASIASCLGKCMLDYINKSDEYFSQSPFRNIKVTYSNSTICISCEVISDKYVNDFKDIVSECYILDNLCMDRSITVKVI